MYKAEVLKKIRVSFGDTTLVVNAPNAFNEIILDEKYDTIPQQGKSYDYVIVFFTSKLELSSLLKNTVQAGKYDCLLWICYPKGGGSIKSDLNRNVVWELASIHNIRPVTNVALDETWSGLRMRPIEVVK